MPTCRFVQQVRSRAATTRPQNAGENPSGVKIWLVLSSDVHCDNDVFRQVWNPTEYLFEYDLISYDDTDV